MKTTKVAHDPAVKPYTLISILTEKVNTMPANKHLGRQPLLTGEWKTWCGSVVDAAQIVDVGESDCRGCKFNNPKARAKRRVSEDHGWPVSLSSLSNTG